MKLFKRPTKTASGIPIGFTEVEYIENTSVSTSTASYIDTGVEAVPGTSLMVSFSFNSTTAGQAMGQGYLAGSRFTVTGLDTNQANFSYAYNNWYRTDTPIDTNRHTFELDTYNKTYRIDNTVTNLASVTYTSEGFTIGLFARFCNSSGTKLVNWNAAGKLYRAVIKVNDVLVRDMIPCLDSSNVPCMYDKVEGKPYYNAGTGTFSYGRKIIPVEYLESSGTQYIDTGVTGNVNTKIDILFSKKNQAANYIRGIVGSRGSGANVNNIVVGIHNAQIALDFNNSDYATYRYLASNTLEDTQYRAIISKSERSLYKDGVLVGQNTTLCSDTISTGIIRMYGVANYENTSSKIYYCKIYNNNVIQRDYMPVKDENGVGYMLDAVSHTLYANNGTGTFTYGSETYSEPHPYFVKTVNKNIYNGLPTGFTEVEYLESTGTQYIDTGYKPVPATTKFEFMFQPDTIAGNSFLFGCRPDTGIGGFTCTTYFATGSVRQDWAGLGTYFPTTNVNTKYLYTAYDNSISLNSDSVTGTTSRSTTRLNFNFLLFTVNTNGTADTRRFIGKIYFSRLWDAGVLVRDFIPCVDASGRPCMYDKVEGKPYYNLGTDDFTYGPKIIPVEYIESSGTQYIDTSVIAKSGLSSLLDFEYTALDTTSISMLDARSSDNRFYLCHTGNANGYWFYYGYGSAVQSSVTPTVNTRYKVETTLKSGTQLMKVNGTTILSGTSATTYNLNTSLYLFGINYNTPQFLAKAKLYTCKIYDNDTLVRDMIPVKDENNVGYMFDRVTHALYGNAGTGVFTHGNAVKMITTRALAENINVIPKLYQQVNYLKASAQQYIDTGIYGKTGVKAKLALEWDPEDIGKDRYALGASTGSYRVYFGTYQSRWMYGYGSYVTEGTPLANTYYDAEVSWESGNQYVKINDETIITGTSTAEISIQNKIILFARNQDSPNYYSAAKIYYCKMWEDGRLVRWYIPVIRKSDSKPGMYDVINQNFCVNNRAGVDDFTYG